MLSRIANNLFWMGRYLKRSEAMARFTEVQYYAALDAPLTHTKKQALNSIRAMTGQNNRLYGSHPSMFDEAVLFEAVLEESNPLSLLSSVASTRENARSARDILPEELWEAINRYFHYLRTFPAGKLKNRDAYEMLREVCRRALEIRAIIETRMLRDETWLFAKMGIHLEEAIQATRIARTKVEDINRIPEEMQGTPVENYQWTTLLKSIGDIRIVAGHGQSVRRRKEILDFALLRGDFPGSVRANMDRVHDLANLLARREAGGESALAFLAGKLAARLAYTLPKEIIGEPLPEFLARLEGELYAIGNALEERYLG